MIDLHLKKLRARAEISADEEAAIYAGVREVIEVQPDSVVVQAGHPTNVCSILLSGTACRRKDLPGGTRQVTELHVPGDYTDLHSFTLKHLDHDIVALTRCKFALTPHSYMEELTDRFPRLARVYWFATNMDAAIHREWGVSLGARNAAGRMAHLFCELYVRNDVVGLVSNNSYALGITQEELAECLGITAVHTNRTLQELRSQGCVEFARGRVTIMKSEALRQIAAFDPTYLYLERRHR